MALNLLIKILFLKNGKLKKLNNFTISDYWNPNSNLSLSNLEKKYKN